MNIKVKITVSYEIDNFIDEETLKECYDNSIEKAFKDIHECESLIGLVNFDTEKILNIERLGDEFITPEWLHTIHKDLSYYDCKRLTLFCEQNTITHKSCYGNGSIIYPKFKEYIAAVESCS